MTGGLASPPESRLNSPAVAMGSSQLSSSANLSPAKYVNPRDIVSIAYLGGELDQLENDEVDCRPMLTLDSNKSEDDLTAVGSDGDPMQGVESNDSEKSDGGSSRVEDAVQPVVRVISKKLVLGVSSEEGSLEVEDMVEPMLGVGSKKPEEGSSEDEDVVEPMVGVVSKKLDEGSSKENDESDRVLNVESEKLPDILLEVGDEDVLMIDVESRKTSEDRLKDVDGGVKSQEVKSMKPLSDLSEDKEKGEPMFGFRSTKLSSDSLQEKEKGDPIMAIESSLDSLHVEDSSPMIGVESEPMDMSATLAEPFELRRSSRKAALKNKPSQKLVTNRKFSSGKTKPASKNVDILLEVSLQTPPCNKS